MAYAEQAPGPCGAAAALSYGRLEARRLAPDARGRRRVLQLPDATLVLICVLRDGRAGRVWLLGPSRRGRLWTLPTEVVLSGVRLGVGGARILGVDPLDLRGRRLDYARVDPIRADAFARASEAVRWPVARAYDALLAGWAAAAPPGDPRLEALLAALRAPRGGSVGDLARRHGFGERHLRRIVPQAVGLGPKGFAAADQLRFACERFVALGSWPQAAAEAGYHDAAHLSREVLAAFGARPREVGRRLQALSPGFLPRSRRVGRARA